MVRSNVSIDRLTIMAKPKRFSNIQPKQNSAGLPQGSYDGAIKNPEVAATFGRMASLWPHIEDGMIDVLTELLGGNAELPSRQIFRSIVSPQTRIKVKLVNISSLELVQLMTLETINRSAGHNSDLDTFAVE
jgi:hypothetical protein